MSRRFFPAVVATLLVPAAGLSQPPTVRIATADHESVAATVTYEVRTATFTANRWTAFLPEPPELPSQTKVKATADPAGKVVAEKSPLARKVRMIDLPVKKPADAHKLTLKLDIKATLRSRRLVPLKEGEKPPAVAPLTAAEKKFYLARSRLVDFDTDEFKEWLDKKKLHRTAGEPPMTYAARVLEVIRADYTYRFNPAEDRRASVACGATSTDCGGMTFLFVGAMRSSGIPARVLVGRLLKPRKADARPKDMGYDQPHVRAEMYVGGIGWVPVDPAYANGAKGRPVESFVGTDPGDLLVLHVDLDLQLPFAEQNRVAELLQIEPYYWATGQGRFDPGPLKTGWDVKITTLDE
jgi:hypothetical protein